MLWHAPFCPAFNREISATARWLGRLQARDFLIACHPAFQTVFRRDGSDQDPERDYSYRTRVPCLPAGSDDKADLPQKRKRGLGVSSANTRSVLPIHKTETGWLWLGLCAGSVPNWESVLLRCGACLADCRSERNVLSGAKRPDFCV